MSRARISSAALKRVAALEAPKTANRAGVLVVPNIMGIDEWEAAYAKWHAELIQLEASEPSTREGSHITTTLNR